MVWTQRLPRAFVREAYRAGTEYAWPRDVAIQVLGSLTALGMAVLGVEVWTAVKPAPQLPGTYVYGSETVRRPGESWRAFVIRSNAGAMEYIDRIAWDPRDADAQGCIPWFNLTVLEPPDDASLPEDSGSSPGRMA